MGYESKMSLALKSESAEKFLEAMGDPTSLNSPLYGADIDKADGYVEISWPYEKYGCQDEITEALSKLPDRDYCYLEENEYGEFVNRGSWWDNGMVTPVVPVSFGKMEDPFGEVFNMIKKYLGEEEARKAFDDFSARIACSGAPKP